MTEDGRAELRLSCLKVKNEVWALDSSCLKVKNEVSHGHGGTGAKKLSLGILKRSHESCYCVSLSPGDVNVI